ncbi:DUF4307 domain-containing protein [Lysinibacter cavernae]|uniref:DUF4307 domain-containing protein n=1 Tax=Lysinibacter cavernae TaxID=1640652 RepID=A0A7X5TUD7_9MICO|nr:DUF4307 domain-containing protein [Lysinibacter cavernae]NIH53482.1 hypothetical protein [Lysinibacter cavernae]
MAETEVVDNHLEERYGRAKTGRLDKRVLTALAGVFAVVLIAWVAWAGLNGDNGTLEFRNIGYSIDDEANVDITFDVTVVPNTPVACALQSLSESYGVVGYKVVVVEPSDQRTRQFTETLRTISEPTTGVVERCWTLENDQA